MLARRSFYVFEISFITECITNDFIKNLSEYTSCISCRILYQLSIEHGRGVYGSIRDDYPVIYDVMTRRASRERQRDDKPRYVRVRWPRPPRPWTHCLPAATQQASPARAFDQTRPIYIYLFMTTIRLESPYDSDHVHAHIPLWSDLVNQQVMKWHNTHIVHICDVLCQPLCHIRRYINFSVL